MRPIASQSPARASGWAVSSISSRAWARWLRPKMQRPALLGDHGRVLERGRGLDQPGDDGRAVALGVPRAEGDHGVPAVGVQRPDDEVGLAAEARVDPAAHEAGIGLVEQVDLQSGVERAHHGVRGDGRPGRSPSRCAAPGHAGWRRRRRRARGLPKRNVVTIVPVVGRATRRVRARGRRRRWPRTTRRARAASASDASTASGISPMPTWIVEPSSTSVATPAPMAAVSVPHGPARRRAAAARPPRWPGRCRRRRARRRRACRACAG